MRCIALRSEVTKRLTKSVAMRSVVLRCVAVRRGAQRRGVDKSVAVRRSVAQRSVAQCRVAKRRVVPRCRAIPLAHDVVIGALRGGVRRSNAAWCEVMRRDRVALRSAVVRSAVMRGNLLWRTVYVVIVALRCGAP